VAFAGRAVFDGCISVTRWPREVVESFLPAELELVEEGGAAEDQHPVIVVFGRQRETALIFGGIAAPSTEDYDEFGIAVPFVRRPGTPDLLTYIPTMYASYFPATWVGRHLFGLGKRIARARWEDPFSIWVDEDGRTVFHAIVQRETEKTPTGGIDASDLAVLSRVAALPVVGRRHSGEWMGCYFAWDFTSARTHPIRCAMSIDERLWGAVPARSFYGEVGSTMWVEGLLWRLSWPYRCDF
jgi:hypothetical protein